MAMLTSYLLALSRTSSIICCDGGSLTTGGNRAASNDNVALYRPLPHPVNRRNGVVCSLDDVANIPAKLLMLTLICDLWRNNDRRPSPILATNMIAVT